MTEDSEYPDWRTALQDNGGLVNLYCVVKYFAWHFSYTIFVLCGAICTVVVVPFFLGWRILRYSLIRADRAIRRTWRRAFGERYVEFEERVSYGLDRASTKPVTRRIVNYCPVNFNIEPRWFENLKDLGVRIIEWAEPPEIVAVCPGCGDTWHYKDEDDECYKCDENFVRVSENEATEVHPEASP